MLLLPRGRTLSFGAGAVEIHELVAEAEQNDEWMYILQSKADAASEYDRGWQLFKEVPPGLCAAAFKALHSGVGRGGGGSLCGVVGVPWPV